VSATAGIKAASGAAPPMPRALAAALALVTGQARRAFPAETYDRFAETCRRLAEATDESAAVAYARHAPACAALLGVEGAFALARAMETAASQAGGSAAGPLAPLLPAGSAPCCW